MTNKEVLKQFKDTITQEKYQDLLKHDKPALRFEWGCYIDSLCKDGEITQKQYETWTYPDSWN